MKTLFRRPAIISAVVASTILTGCVTSLVLGGVAATSLVVSDRRTAGMQLTDETIGITIQNRVSAQLNSDVTRVIADSFNQRVLLTGEVATAADKAKVEEIAKGVTDVKDVVNELMIGPVASFSTRSNDSWITSKVRSELLITKNIPSRTISITTSQGVVYLMGQVTRAEGELAAQAASKISGVVRVVKVFDILSDQEARAINNGTSSTSTTTSTSTTSSNNVQTHPLK